MKLQISISSAGDEPRLKDEFVDRHAPNTHDLDTLEFIETVKHTTGISKVTLDQSDYPIVFIRASVSRLILAWYDDDDLVGYCPPKS